MNTIHIILTGGTLDSHWSPAEDTAVPNKSSVVPQFLESIKSYEKFVFSEVCMKDSRSLTKQDVNQILQEIEESPHTRFIVTHGTYTMPDTARFLQANLRSEKKTIVLTGSMIPLQGFSPSDGPFSLGFAIAKLQDLEPGVYVCMNARVFSPDEVVKVISEGRFSSVFNK